MNSPHDHSHGWASGTSTFHAGYADVQQHLDDSSHVFDELVGSSSLATQQQVAALQPPKAKVLFQFFDGWPMAES